MKLLVNSYERIISPENLWSAWCKYRRGKRGMRIRAFEESLEANMLSIRYDLSRESYSHGPYVRVVIQDSKRRTIHIPTVRDCIVHRAMYEILMPFCEKIFMSCSFASRKSKGLHGALENFRKQLRQAKYDYKKDVWVLHGDIKKYFASIDRGILMSLLKKRIGCKRTTALLEEVIDSFASERGSDKGIPLGNVTSQIFGNLYLHELDWFVKQTLHAPYYLRYADDFVLATETEHICIAWAERIRRFLSSQLLLEFPSDHQIIRPIHKGIDFLGHRFVDDYCKIKKETKQRMSNHFLRKSSLSKQGLLPEDHLQSTWGSYQGMLAHGMNEKLRHKLVSMAL